MNLSAAILVATSLAAPVYLDPPVGPPQVDLDADGVADVLTADPALNTVTLTGAGGVVLRTFAPPAGQGAQGFGTAARLIPDATGDGVPELAVLSPGAVLQGAVDLFNPVTGVRLWRSLAPVTTPAADGWWFLDDVAPVADQNDDGRPDLLVTASSDGESAKYTALLDGLTGRILAVRGWSTGDLLGLVVGGTRLYRATDTNDDGLVNSADFAQFLDWLMNADNRADVNNDGAVNGLDLDLMMRDLLDGAITMMTEGGSGGGAGGTGGSGGSGGGGGSGGSGGAQAVTITPGSCTTIWASTSGYNPCTTTCTPQTVLAACGAGVAGEDLFRYFSPYCGGGTDNLITHRTGELTVQGILQQLAHMHVNQTGAISAGNVALNEVSCIPNDGIDWSDVLAFGWSTDQPLMVDTQVTNDGASLLLTLSGEVSTFAVVNIYFHIWVRDANNDPHLCCFRIPFTVLPDCAYVTMRKADETTTASPLVCPGMLLAEQPMVMGATFSPLGGVARWTVTYTMAVGSPVVTTNIGPTALINAPAGATTVRVDVDYQYGTPYTCGPASDSEVFTVEPDGDGDGLPDECESQHPCLNPFFPDTDGDSFNDGVELALGSDPCLATSTPSISIDTDGDGLTDYEEIAIHRTDPRRVDTDNDGADDFGEVELQRLGHLFSPLDAFSLTRNLGQPLCRDGYTGVWADADLDNDHLSDLLEDIRGLRSDRADSDGDGIPDGVELRAGLNLSGFDAGWGDGFATDDSDGDGLSDALELRLGLDPRNSDSDGDGLRDGLELTAGLDPLNSDSLGVGSGVNATTADGVLDSDGDGLTNAQEQMYGTSPTESDTDMDGASDLAEVQGGTCATTPLVEPGEQLLMMTVTVRKSPRYTPCWRALSHTVHIGNLAVSSPEHGQTVVTVPVVRGRTLPFRISHQGAALDMDEECLEYFDTFTGDRATLLARFNTLIQDYRGTDYSITFKSGSDPTEMGIRRIGAVLPTSPIGYDDEYDNWLYNMEGSYCDPWAWFDVEYPPWCLGRSARFDARRGSYVIPRIATYDLRYFRPENYNETQFKFERNALLPEATLRAPQSNAPASSSFGARVMGATADGASLCLLRLETEPAPFAAWRSYCYLSVELLKSIPTEEVAEYPVQDVGEGNVTRLIPSVSGYFVSDLVHSGSIAVDATGSIAPIDKSFVANGPPLTASSSAYLFNGCAIYCPPATYIPRTPVEGRPEYWLNDGDQTQMQFRVGGFDGGYIDTPFVIRRPPLVLVHGINSSAEVWNRWQPAGLEPNEYEVSARMYLVDYGASSAKGYSENLKALYYGITRALTEARAGRFSRNDTVFYESLPEGGHTWDWKSSGRYPFDQLLAPVAATRVDVIAHSQGGQIARLYLSDLQLSGLTRQIPGAVEGESGGWASITVAREAIMPYTDSLVGEKDAPVNMRPDNYYSSDIGKLIAIGSPFRGSPFANAAEPKMRPNKRVRMRPYAERESLDDSFPQSPEDLQNIDSLVDFAKFINVAVVKSKGGSSCYYDLRTDSVIQSRMQLAGYPSAVNWIPVVGIGYQSGDPVPTISLMNAVLKGVSSYIKMDSLPFPEGEQQQLLTKWFRCSDGIVSVWSQTNRPLLASNVWGLDAPLFDASMAWDAGIPGQFTYAHPVYHSTIPVALGECDSFEIRRASLKALSDFSNFQWLDGNKLGAR